MIPRAQKRQSPLHFRRIEVKYRMPNRIIPSFIERISPYTEIDPFLSQEDRGRTSYPVLSLYFDSIDLQCLHEKEAGLLSRRKLRLRTYRDTFSETAPCFLEIKRRLDSIIAKDRLKLSVGHLNSQVHMSGLLDHLLERVEASAEVTTEANLMRGWFSLQPTSLVRYKRIPFIGKQDRRFRITIDTALEGAWNPTHLIGFDDFRTCLHDESIVELKFHHAIPGWLHDIVKEFELSRVASSKYALVTEAFHPSTLAPHATCCA
jgi:hypothetical protein